MCVDGALVDNVAESGDESEDEWNYFKGEGEHEDNPSEEPDEAPRSDTPAQDNVSQTTYILAQTLPTNSLLKHSFFRQQTYFILSTFFF